MTPVSRLVRVLISTGAAAGLVTAGASTASADPTGQTATIVCDNGVTYTAVVFSSGAWSPALDTASNSVLIPVSFGVATFVVRDADGNVIDSGSDPAGAKGHAAPPLSTRTSCTYTITRTVTDPELGQLTVVESGPVTGFVTPAA
jgi:hypothetical protein